MTHRMKRRPRSIVEKGMTEAEILRYRNGCELRKQLTRVAPKAVVETLSDLVGGLLGNNFDEVVAFALISFLHDRAGKLEELRRRRLVEF